MAKITPSSLITAIQGQFNGDTFQLWKTAIIRRRTGRPPRRPRQSKERFKGLASQIAGKWDALSQSQKDGWNTLAEQFPIQLSGFNVFLRNNVALLYADNPGLCYYETVGGCYYTPPTPAPLSIAWIASSQSFCVSWTTPACTSHYAQVFSAAQAGYSNRLFPKLHLEKTTRSDSLHCTVDGSKYPNGTVIRFRVRTIDVYGMMSPYSDIITATRE